jgi:hypothetical protein
MTSMTSKVLSLRLDSELFDRLHDHAAKRGMSVQDYVVRTLVRDDFDERFQASVERTERFYGSASRTDAEEPGRPGRRPAGADELTARPAPARSGRA